jgi:hypothetical protein
MRRTTLAICALLVAVSGAEAVVFTLDPSALVVSPGDSVSLDLVASGLGGAVIGDFDLDIDFDPARLTLTGFTLANGLGDVSSGEALDFGLGLVVPGLLNLAVVSTLSEAELLAVQSDPLTVATLTFDVGALGPGTSTTVAVATVNALGDADGAALSVTALGDATLRVPGGIVPGPDSLWLLASGLLVSGVMRRHIRRASW